MATHEELQEMPGYRQARELMVTVLGARFPETEIRDLVITRNEDTGGRRSYTLVVEGLVT